MAKHKFFYDSLEDSTRRISQSVVMARQSPKHDLEPCWVQQIQGLNTNQEAQALFLPWPQNSNPKAVVLPLTPEYFEVRKIPQLGYVDYGDHSFYLSRRPVRNGKQGICRGNLVVPQTAGIRGVPNFEAFLNRREFYNLFLDKYDTMRHVFEKILSSEEPLKRAFSKTMALSVDDMESVSLWNRGLRVGLSNNPRKHGPVFRLPKTFRHLKEELEENGIKVE